MKTLDKVAALAMTLALAFVLTACGGTSSASSADAAASESAATSETSASTSAESASATAESASAASASAEAASGEAASAEAASAEAASASAEAASASAEAASAASASAEAASASAAAAENGFKPGVVDGITYRSEYFGVAMGLPEGYAFSNAEQLATRNKAIGENKDAASIASALDKGISYVDAHAQNADGTILINMTIDSLPAVDSSLEDAEGYLNYTLEQVGPLFENKSGKVRKAEVTTVKIGDKEYPTLKATVDISGKSLGEQTVSIQKGDYVLNITVTASKQEQVDELIGKIAQL